MSIQINKQRFNTASGKYYCNQILKKSKEDMYLGVSIPQAVSTIAMLPAIILLFAVASIGFNTASGKYYCNLKASLQRTVTIMSLFQYRKR